MEALAACHLDAVYFLIPVLLACLESAGYLLPVLYLKSVASSQASASCLKSDPLEYQRLALQMGAQCLSPNGGGDLGPAEWGKMNDQSDGTETYWGASASLKPVSAWVRALYLEIWVEKVAGILQTAPRGLTAVPSAHLAPALCSGYWPQ